MKNIFKKFLCAATMALSCVLVAQVANAAEHSCKIRVKGQVPSSIYAGSVWISSAADPDNRFRVLSVRKSADGCDDRGNVYTDITIIYDDEDPNCPDFLRRRGWCDVSIGTVSIFGLGADECKGVTGRERRRCMSIAEYQQEYWNYRRWMIWSSLCEHVPLVYITEPDFDSSSVPFGVLPILAFTPPDRTRTARPDSSECPGTPLRRGAEKPYPQYGFSIRNRDELKKSGDKKNP